VNIFSYVLFFLAGLGFGYAVAGGKAWIPLAFPILLAIGAMLRDGLSAEILVKLLVALAITAAGVVLGSMLEDRQARQAPGAA
jgi:hypothetical protein